MPDVTISDTPYAGDEGKEISGSTDGAETTRCGTTWDVRMGFHAIPSLPTVHLHVYSLDLVSHRLKNAKHYNSFQPDSGFCIPPALLQQWINEGKKTLPQSKAQYEALLKKPLKSFYPSKWQAANMPAMKAHLNRQWGLLLEEKRSKEAEPKTSV